jgi:hypothetical protein
VIRQAAVRSVCMGSCRIKASCWPHGLEGDSELVQLHRVREAYLCDASPASVLGVPRRSLTKAASKNSRYDGFVGFFDRNHSS